MFRRVAVVVGFGVVAACGGTGTGSTECMYQSGGALTFVVHGGAYVASCFQSVAALPSGVETTIEASAPPPTMFDTSGVAVMIGLVTEPRCPWAPHTTVSLASPCLAIQAREMVNAGNDHLLWTVVGGAAALDAVMKGAPQPTGSLTVDAWATAAGQPLSISFSDDAALTYPAGFENNGPTASLAPVSGSIGTVTQAAGG